MTVALRCARWARDQAVDPIGSIGSHEGYVLLEWPLPWPRDIGEAAELGPLVEAVADTGVRIQAVVPRRADTGARRVIVYRRPTSSDGWFAGFQRAERVAPHDELVEVAVDLVRSTARDSERRRVGGDAPVDVLVCSHGKRDVCCGSMGTALVTALSSSHTESDQPFRVWRTSHTGGHRFAPTALVLPDGTGWAFLDSETLLRIACREGALDDLLARYRGCSGLGSRAVQAIERLAFAEVGWSWLDHRRRGIVDDDGHVRLDAVSPSGELLRWEGIARAGRHLPVPECGLPIKSAKKAEMEWVIADLARTDPTSDRSHRTEPPHAP